MNYIMHIDEAGKKLIFLNEGISFNVYKDSKGLATIGVGHKLTPTENFTTITISQLEDLFTQDLIARESLLLKLTGKWIQPITQGEFNALISFMWQYHILNSNYCDTKAAIISGDRDRIIKQMLQFKNIVKGSGDNKLIPRRNLEIEVFKS